LAGHWFWDAVMLHSAHPNVYLETSCNGSFSISYKFLLEWEMKGPKDRVNLLRIDNHVMFGLDLGPARYAEFIRDWRQFIETAGKPQFMDAFFYKNAANVIGIKV
jgi:predicted TIM-barrel fold metal-dependent hydrolase